MGNELKPCPFCGGKAVLIESIVNVYFYNAEYSGTIICMGCGVKMSKDWCESYDKTTLVINSPSVKECWNRRANNDKL